MISSGLYGTMSGSPTSDVVATESITIPIMKRLGYSKRFSGAVEVAASTGGSAMPPIMGSAAFILAEHTGTAYREVVYAALIPAVLYYVGVFAQVHLRAMREDLRPYNGEIPKLSRTFVLGWPFIVPIAVMIGMLWVGYSPVMTAGAGALGVVVGTALSSRTRMSLWGLIDALGETTLRILPVAGACAAAGLVIGGLRHGCRAVERRNDIADTGFCKCGQPGRIARLNWHRSDRAGPQVRHHAARTASPGQYANVQ